MRRLSIKVLGGTVQRRDEQRFTNHVIRLEWLTEEIATTQSVSGLELLAAEARSALAGHPELAQLEAAISARQRLLSRAGALLDEIARCDAGEEAWW